MAGQGEFTMSALPFADVGSASAGISWDDHLRFARLSGDTNPMHVDALAARRTQAGEPVVHGVHGMLWALDAAARGGVLLDRLSRIDAQFNHFIFPARRLSVRLDRRDETASRVELAMGGDVATRLTLRFGEQRTVVKRDAFDALTVIPPVDGPRDQALEQLSGLSGWLMPPPSMAELPNMFPALSDSIGPDRVIGLAMTTYLVGMICPGLHSIFAALAVDLTDAPCERPGLGFIVDQAHEHLRVVRMQVSANRLSGNVRTFLRWPPVASASMNAVSGHVSPDAFGGTNALIVGGSRYGHLCGGPIGCRKSRSGDQRGSWTGYLCDRALRRRRRHWSAGRCYQKYIQSIVLFRNAANLPGKGIAVRSSGLRAVLSILYRGILVAMPGTDATHR
jgi:acyl dehydratase